MKPEDQQLIDNTFMQQALLLAKSASECGEVPVGALVVKDGEIIARAANGPISTNDPTAHAEILALRKASATLENYRLPASTLYVTLEPCIMCMGAIIHARVQRLVFGAYDPKTGAAGSRYTIGNDGLLNHWLEITGGVCEAECGDLLKDFFRARRKQK
ncbi:MAG: tRNA adenosine(34) deaminase TadA [Desulfocapsa sp.]|nr:tRNA adenosine(34) deaminase TadA [Desulfocapsa sp.]